MVQSLFKAALCALSLISSVAALPRPVKPFADVIPGPGLPTLAELGLTSEQLHTMEPSPGKCLPIATTHVEFKSLT